MGGGGGGVGSGPVCEVWQVHARIIFKTLMVESLHCKGVRSCRVLPNNSAGWVTF